MGGSSSSLVGSAFLQSLTFMGGPGTSSTNQLAQSTALKSSPATVNTQAANMGNAPINYTPLTAPQFYNGQTFGPYKYLSKINDTGNNPTTTSSNNYLEYILLIGGGILIIVIIAKNKNNS